MFRTGRNFIDGIAVDVERKRVRRINVRIAPDGVIHLSIPAWGCTIAEGETFLRANWKWAVAARARAMARRTAAKEPVTPEQNAAVARDILANKKGPKYDIVMMNAGAAIYIGGKANSIAEGINLAKELVASGAAKKKLDEFIELSNK